MACLCENETKTLYGKYNVYGDRRTMIAHETIMNAIAKHPNPVTTSGEWFFGLGVWGKQMQAKFCLRCGEYEWLLWDMRQYTKSRNKPLCKCKQRIYK